MWKILALFFLAAVEARPHTELYQSFDFPRIVGGSPAFKGQYPFQLSLQHNNGASWYHTCGASLISASKALTAAHCTHGRANFRVRAGATSLSPSDHEQQADALPVEHWGYDESGSGIPNDIATLHLGTSISAVGAVGYASLPSSNAGTYAGNEVSISGWGKTDGWDSSGSNVLNFVSTFVISQSECSSRMPTSVTITSAHICIFKSGTGSCQGDSGGPMTHSSNGLMIGVTSFGIGNMFDSCLTNYPSVYTRVSTYRAWIDAN